MADVIAKCLASERYHLRLLGLTLAEDAAHGLDDTARRVVLDAVRSVPTDNIILNTSIVEALSAFGDITPARDLDDIAAEIAAVLAMQHDPNARKMACGIVSAQFENEAIGPYFEAVQALSPPADRERLLAMALGGDDTDGLSIGWILHELDDLSDSYTRRAVVEYVARTDPSRWFSAQWGIQAIVSALALLAADGVALPDPADEGSTDPAWRASMTVITGALAAARGWPVDRQAVGAAWAALVGEHRDVLASLLMNLRHMHGLQPRQPEAVHDQVVAAMPTGGVDALVWSLQHPDQVRSLGRYDHGLSEYVIGLLGRLGGRPAAEVLRRYTDDPNVGQAAAAAVRAIEQRSNAEPGKGRR